MAPSFLSFHSLPSLNHCLVLDAEEHLAHSRQSLASVMTEERSSEIVEDYKVLEEQQHSLVHSSQEAHFVMIGWDWDWSRP